MSTHGLKKWALLLTFWLALQSSALRAQLLGPYGTSPITFEVDANGLLWATGTYGTGSLSLSGAGTRMFWYPGKAAFRAGYVSGTQWDSASIGAYSAAFGKNALASGNASAAFGSGTTASGVYSMAFGISTLASGYYATAGGNTTTASGLGSTAFGSYTTASGSYSTAFGRSTTASGSYSTTLGFKASAISYDSLAVGRYNLGTAETGAASSSTTWVSVDPLFEVGNGTSSSVKDDALVVYKNGDAEIQGSLDTGGSVTAPAFVTTAATGDIPMFTGY